MESGHPISVIRSGQTERWSSQNDVHKDKSRFQPVEAIAHRRHNAFTVGGADQSGPVTQPVLDTCLD
ncbi:hypothetical protein EVAR_95696_1 [Eumeta japonica]|uniref:Uncharacterized protein n=1 Tax=Eumeta variegata TaxID=151549 RepID=A0A4C1VIZ1_EUMVA|nr:hypothetical protein EVAR_95696_1 [Eumeta japonica]